MGGYEQLSLDDRCEIARLCAEGRSIRQIAATLDRAPSTISRELKRNRGRELGYQPGYAQQQPCWSVLPTAGHPNRSPAGSRARLAAR